MIPLNESQQRSLLFAILDIHRRMAEMESNLSQGAVSSPFSQYVNDLSPTEGKVIRDYFARIRTTMLACVHEGGIPLEVRRTSVRWALQCGMTFLNIAVADMGPERLRGYGPLAEAARPELLKVQQDLNRLIDRAAAYLQQGLGRDLAERLARLEASRAGTGALTVLNRVIDRWRLVEFRPLLDTIVQRLEAPQFEIAVFGRVSSGKSSLLNRVAGMDVLPVGVTPITAVPTRLVRGDQPAGIITFAEMGPRQIAVEQLREYASEEGNPGNRKHVTGILVQLPAPRLRDGVVLVDTPGFGSLALSGSAETFAYLPRCDLGVVLIDAASTPNQDDLGLLRLLYEAGIPAQVLLSKADLLAPADRQRLANYTREQLRRELGLDLPVHPVSTVGADEALLTRWFEGEIAPLFERQRALTKASLQRKIAHLRESVLAVLQTLRARYKGGAADGPGSANLKRVRRLLDETEAAVRQATVRWQEWNADEPALVRIIFDDAARALGDSAPGRADGQGPILGVVRQVLTERSRTTQAVVAELQQTLAGTLEELHRTAPLANADASAVRDLVFSGLPVLDLSPLRGEGQPSRPWWAALSRPLAFRAIRRVLERQQGPVIRELTEGYDRQLRAWLKGSIAQLVELYESQAEVFREQVRRLTVAADGADTPAEVRDLAADLQELQRTAAAAQEAIVANSQAASRIADPTRP
jgi:GTP-binding protein EngB required for normal cell division